LTTRDFCIGATENIAGFLSEEGIPYFTKQNMYKIVDIINNKTPYKMYFNLKTSEFIISNAEYDIEILMHEENIIRIRVFPFTGFGIIEIKH